MFVRTFLVSLFFLFVCFPSYAEKITITGTLKNGTTSGIGKADSLKLIALQGGMVPIAELGAQSGNFQFRDIEVPEGAPLLLQAIYLGVNYNKMIPPVASFRNAIQEVTVFESSDSMDQIKIKSLMQVVREKNGMRIFKLFLIENTSKPPKSFQNKKMELEFFVPSEASEIFSQLQQPGSKMAIPLTLVSGKLGGKIMDRAILPGLSELQVSYLVKDDSWKELLLLEGKQESLPIFVRPTDMQLEVKGGDLTKLEKDIPAGLTAFALRAKPNGSGILEVSFTATGGKPVPIQTQGEREIVNGTILNSWESSLFAVIGFVALFFSLSFIFVYKIKKGNSLNVN